MRALKLQLCGVCLALATAALTLLVVRGRRAVREHRQIEPADLPIPVRYLGPVAAPFVPLAKRVLPRAMQVRLTAELEALGLSPALSPERWVSLRLAEAATLAALAVLLFRPDVWLLLMLAAGGYFHGSLWLKRRRESQQREIVRELPAWLDLMTICVEAGATLTSGLRLIVAQAPPGTLRDFFERVLREVRGGRPRAQAFSHVAGIYGSESLSTLASALAHAEASGMSLGQVLRAQAGQRTAERFARAEKLAMQAPVKMLGPLIFCIFPCTFIVIGVPIAVRLKEAIGA